MKANENKFLNLLSTILCIVIVASAVLCLFPSTTVDAAGIGVKCTTWGETGQITGNTSKFPKAGEVKSATITIYINKAVKLNGDPWGVKNVSITVKNGSSTIRATVIAYGDDLNHDYGIPVKSVDGSSLDGMKQNSASADYTPSATATPKPATATPKPATATPKPATATPKPATATPKPATATPKPATATPKPATATPKPATATPKPATATPTKKPAATPVVVVTATPKPTKKAAKATATPTNKPTKSPTKAPKETTEATTEATVATTVNVLPSEDNPMPSDSTIETTSVVAGGETTVETTAASEGTTQTTVAVAGVIKPTNPGDPDQKTNLWWLWILLIAAIVAAFLRYKKLKNDGYSGSAIALNFIPGTPTVVSAVKNLTSGKKEPAKAAPTPTNEAYPTTRSTSGTTNYAAQMREIAQAQRAEQAAASKQAPVAASASTTPGLKAPIKRPASASINAAARNSQLNKPAQVKTKATTTATAAAAATAATVAKKPESAVPAPKAPIKRPASASVNAAARNAQAPSSAAQDAKIAAQKAAQARAEAEKAMAEAEALKAEAARAAAVAGTVAAAKNTQQTEAPVAPAPVAPQKKSAFNRTVATKTNEPANNLTKTDANGNPIVVNGYLQKSNTAPIRPMYSNTAENRAAQARVVEKKASPFGNNAPKKEIPSEEPKVAPKTPSRPTTKSGEPSLADVQSSNRFDYATQMKAMAEAQQAERQAEVARVFKPAPKPEDGANN